MVFRAPKRRHSIAPFARNSSLGGHLDRIAHPKSASLSRRASRHARRARRAMGSRTSSGRR
ncbi:Hypothetical protein A7982_00798 [Minicystis rosea]|nr:Hypothetical protein A7982_00798 [Minicystis rosea]